MKTKEEIEQLAELYVWGGIYLSEQEKQQTEIAYMTGYTQCQEDNKNKKYTEEDMLKAIEKARDIFDGKDCFTAEDVSGCTEVCTYDWKFQFSEDDIINSLNKQD
jgi:hypothetical protein